MLQVLQDINSGQTKVVEVPEPLNIEGHSLITSSYSLISSGTEKMLVDFGKSGLLGKALGQPEKVKMVLDKIKTDGLSPTYSAIKSKLDEPMELGYCNVGKIKESTSNGLSPGMRVVSNGKHAGVVRVPNNLIARIPNNVSDEEAAFTVLGSIALQGIRLVNPSIGETVVVTGLGLVGLIAVQILRANGCRVLGIDLDTAKCEIARQFGAEIVDLSKDQNPITVANAYSREKGVDAVLITASAKGNTIIHEAATMCRKRGRIVLIGVVGLELNRADFYEKELTFQVSCSYGPGRYDVEYEEKGNDYPFAFVRWTEQRNFEAVLDLMDSGAIDVKPLISQRFDITDAKTAYEQLDNSSTLGILLDYRALGENLINTHAVNLCEKQSNRGRKGNVSFIGAGNYAARVLIPAFKNAGANLMSLITSGGVSAVHYGKKNGFVKASTDIQKALDEQTDTVVIATRHNLHATQIILALEKGKHVFVEKPLALTHEEIDKIEASHRITKNMVMVGYNRRFSPHIEKIKCLLDAKPLPKTFIMTMNAGEIPKTHWTQKAEVGGGRIIGEACHYIDLMRYLAGSKIKSFNVVKMGENDFVEVTEDKALISLTFEDGSIGSIHYFANGGKSFPKERIEVFCDNSVLQLDNFRKLRGYGWKGFNKMNLWSQDKGQENCVAAFMNSVREGIENPIPQDEIFEVARVSVDIAEMLRK